MPTVIMHVGDRFTVNYIISSIARLQQNIIISPSPWYTRVHKYAEIAVQSLCCVLNPDAAGNVEIKWTLLRSLIRGLSRLSEIPLTHCRNYSLIVLVSSYYYPRYPYQDFIVG